MNISQRLPPSLGNGAATTDRVPTVYVENHRVAGLDPNDPIQVNYDHKIGNWPTDFLTKTVKASLRKPLLFSAFFLEKDLFNSI